MSELLPFEIYGNLAGDLNRPMVKDELGHEVSVFDYITDFKAMDFPVQTGTAEAVKALVWILTHAGLGGIGWWGLKTLHMKVIGTGMETSSHWAQNWWAGGREALASWDLYVGPGSMGPLYRVLWHHYPLV